MELPGLPAPGPVSMALRAFPVAGELNPPEKDEISSEFQRANPWSGVVMDLFYSRRDARTLSFLPREGIEAEDAYNTVLVFMGSRDLKHEHKEALCGYALWSWFYAVLVAETGEVLACDRDVIDPEKLQEMFLEVKHEPAEEESPSQVPE